MFPDLLAEIPHLLRPRWPLLGGVLSKLAVSTDRRGVGAAVVEDPFDRIEAYVTQRLADDHGVWATVLFDGIQALGYDGS
ncbi:MAG: hypothetical protein QNL26_15415 [Acidimicrobiia bacterium]|nr:hypothetical protein [Acidimicrobiia bacterium]